MELQQDSGNDCKLVELSLRADSVRRQVEQLTLFDNCSLDCENSVGGGEVEKDGCGRSDDVHEKDVDVGEVGGGGVNGGDGYNGDEKGGDENGENMGGDVRGLLDTTCHSYEPPCRGLPLRKSKLHLRLLSSSTFITITEQLNNLITSKL